MFANLQDIFEIALATRRAFPEPFKTLSETVIIKVDDWPDPAMLSELDLSDPLELTGLYDGIPLVEKSPSFPDPTPDIVWLFSEPIFAELADRKNVTLEELVTHVTVHEFAHHFGWSDEDIAAIDPWWT